MELNKIKQTKLHKSEIKETQTKDEKNIISKIETVTHTPIETATSGFYSNHSIINEESRITPIRKILEKKRKFKDLDFSGSKISDDSIPLKKNTLTKDEKESFQVKKKFKKIRNLTIQVHETNTDNDIDQKQLTKQKQNEDFWWLKLYKKPPAGHLGSHDCLNLN